MQREYIWGLWEWTINTCTAFQEDKYCHATWVCLMTSPNGLEEFDLKALKWSV